MPMTDEERAFARKNLEEAQRQRNVYMITMLEHALEHDLGPKECDDRISAQIAHKAVRRYHDDPQARMPAGIGGICVHRASSNEPEAWVVVTVCNCYDGDLFVAMSKDGAFETGYLIILERRRNPVPLEMPILKLIAEIVARELRPIEPSMWRAHIDDLSQKWNEIQAQIDVLLRQGKTPDA